MSSITADAVLGKRGLLLVGLFPFSLSCAIVVIAAIFFLIAALIPARGILNPRFFVLAARQQQANGGLLPERIYLKKEMFPGVFCALVVGVERCMELKKEFSTLCA